MASLGFLAAFCALSAFDVFYFHVWKERLTHRSEYRRETLLHAWGNGITGCLALALAWFEWRGWALLFPLLLIVAETILGILDYLEEKRSREVGRNEKAAHILMLFLHTGFAVLAGVKALELWARQSAVAPAATVMSIPLTLAAIFLLAGAAMEGRTGTPRRTKA